MTILQRKPKGLYGLQVVAESNNTISRGSVYVLLGRLVMRGFVKLERPKVDPDYPGKPRPIYKLAADGHKVLRNAAEFLLTSKGVSI